ncbi:unnamed protein product, partial [Pylaiella littoralis]
EASIVGSLVCGTFHREILYSPGSTSISRSCWLSKEGVVPEYTPVDGAKGDGRVERKLALIAEGAKKAAWHEFHLHVPDLELPAKANSWGRIWPEAFSWMNECLNGTAQAHTPDKLSPNERLYKKRSTNPLRPFMMPGFRHHNRRNKSESKKG